MESKDLSGYGEVLHAFKGKYEFDKPIRNNIIQLIKEFDPGNYKTMFSIGSGRLFYAFCIMQLKRLCTGFPGRFHYRCKALCGVSP